MITLDDTLSKLQLTTSAAETVHVTVSWIDWANVVNRELRGSQETSITTATTTDILAVPASTRQRQVEHLTVSSTTGTTICTLKKDVNGTDYQIGGAITLAIGEWFVVDGEGTFSVYTAAGKLKVETGSGGGLTDADYGDVTVSGGGTVMTVDSVNVIDAAADTTTWPMLARSITGSQLPTTDAGLTYNAASNALAATTFVGDLTGHADTAGQLTGAGNWKVWYSNGAGESTELALGAAGTYLQSNGAASIPSFATPSGSGLTFAQVSALAASGAY